MLAQTTTANKPRVIRTKTENELHEVRSRGIGASEVPGILGLDPYNSPYKIWQKKTGKLDRDPGNMFTRAGHMLEPVVAEYFNEETGHRVIKNTAGNYAVFHPDHDFVFCHPDREYFIEGTRKRGVLECKTTQKRIDKDNPPMTWLAQMMYQLGILGYPEGSFAWLERGLVFDFIEYLPNYELFDHLVNEAGEFWHNHVLKDIPPDPISRDDIKALYTKSFSGKAVEASQELTKTYSRMVDLKRTMKAIEDEYDELALGIQLVMQDADSIFYGEDTLFTWKSHVQNRIDQSKLKKDHPDIVAQCMKEIPVRSFLIKGV